MLITDIEETVKEDLKNNNNNNITQPSITTNNKKERTKEVEGWGEGTIEVSNICFMKGSSSSSVRNIQRCSFKARDNAALQRWREAIGDEILLAKAISLYICFFNIIVININIIIFY